MLSSGLIQRVGTITSGGTITGDLRIEGDLTVVGSSTNTYDEIVEGGMVIDTSETEAFLIRKASDGGDVFTIDTTNEFIQINSHNGSTKGLKLGTTLVTATGAELNILDGATLSTAELNYVDGVTSAIQTQIDTKAPTASPTFTGTITIGSAEISETELEVLDGLTVTTAEVNILDGITATTAELNYLDITTLGTLEASKALTVDASGNINFNNGNMTNVDIDSGAIDGTNITVGSGKTLDVSGGTLTLAANQISGDKVDGGTISDFASTGIDDNASSNAITIDSSQNIALTSGDLEIYDLIKTGGGNRDITLTPHGTGLVDITSNLDISSHNGSAAGLKLGGTLVTSTATELNLLDGVTAKSGSDTVLITGTAGTNNYTAKWNSDGDLVDGYEVKDEDTMSSNSASALATQQSIKAYVDTTVATEDTLEEMNDTSLSSPDDSHFLVHNGSVWVNETGSTARTSMGLGSIATQASSSVSISGGSISGITDLAIADGGTGSSTASAARTALGLAIGSDVQAYNDRLADITGLATSDSNIMVGNGSTWVAESGGTARTSLGLGSGDSPTFTTLNLTGSIVLEGSTSNDYETTLAVTDPTADRTITFQDGSGTVAFISDVEAEDTLEEMNDVNITSPADASLLFYDTGTSKWIDNVISGDATVTDGGVLTIASNAVEGSMLNTDAISGQTEMTGDVADTDELMVSDAGTLKRADFSVVRDAVFNDVSGDIAIASGGAATIQANSVALATDTTGNYVAGISGTTNEVEVSGSGAENASVTIGLPDDVTIGQDLTVTRNLIVNGTTVTLNTETIEVEDNILQLNTTQGSPDTATATTSGISVYRGDGVTAASLIFDDSDDAWDLTNDLVVAGTLTAGTGSKIVSTTTDSVFTIETNTVTNGFPVLDLVSSHTTIGGRIRSNGTDLIQIDKDLDCTFMGDATVSGTLNVSEYVNHDGDTDTHLRFSADDAIEITAGGVKMMRFLEDDSQDMVVINEDSADIDFRVESNGNANMLFVDGGNDRIGIGTDSPDDKLHVVGNIFITDGSPEITFETTNSSHYNWQIAAQENVTQTLEFSVGSQDADASNDSFTPKMVINSDGEVGIGTTSPDRTLDVTGTGRFTSNVDFGASIYVSAGGHCFLDGGSNTYITETASDQVAIVTGGTERMRIDDSGNVGIGVTDPDSILEINSADDVTTTALKVLALDDGGYTGTVMEVYGTRGPTSAYNIAKFGTNAGTAKIVFSGEGNVGIGTDSPANESSGTLLHIADTGGTNAAHINLSGGTGGDGNQTGKISFSDPGDTDDAVAFISCNVEGTDTNPGGSLHFFTAPDAGSPTERVTIHEDGTATFAGDIKNSSDSKSIYIGASDDLRLLHDGNHSYIDHQNTGNLIFRNLVHGGDINFYVEDSSGTGTTSMVLSDDGTATFAGNVTVSDRVVGSGDLILVTTDSNEKIHMDSDGYMKFETAGSERMRILSGGNVCIGGTSDEGYNTLLNIEGAGGTDDVPGILFKNTSASNDEDIMALIASQGTDSVGAINIKREGNADDAYIDFLTQANSGSMAERMRITSTGYVGIGLTDPNNHFMVGGSSGGDIAVASTDTTINDGDTLGNILFKGKDDGGSGVYGIGAKITALATEAWNEATAEGTSLNFYTTDNTTATNDLRMTIDDNGNVGIGTASPTGHLEISTADNTTYDVSQTDSQRDSGTSLVLYNTSTTTNSFSQLVFRNRNSGTGSVRIAAISKGADNSDLAISNDESDILYIDGSAEAVGIGTTSPGDKVHISGATDSNLHFGVDTADEARIKSLDDATSAYKALKFYGSRHEFLSGDVGIGTASPSATLHVAKDSGTMPSFVSSEIVAVFSNNSATSDGLTIGLVSGNAQNAQIIFGDEQDSDAGAIWYANGTNSLNFRAGGSGTGVTIDSSNNLGIGTSSPAGNLEIEGGDGTVSGTPDSDGNEFVIRNNADAGMSLMAGESSGHTSSIIFGSTSDINGANIFYEYNTKTLKLGTQHASGILTLRSGNGTNALTIDASQNVGIGETAPDALLTLNMGADDDNCLSMKSSDVAHGMTDDQETDTFGIYKKLHSANGGFNVMGYGESKAGVRVRGVSSTEDATRSTSGSAPVSLSAKTKVLSGSGDLSADENLVVIQNNNTTKFIFDSDGDAHADSSWTTFSDRRLKNNITSIPYGLNEVLQLSPKVYDKHSGYINNDSEHENYNDYDDGEVVLSQDSKRMVGFIAQDVKDVLPEMIKDVDESSSFYSMSNADIVPVLVKAIQELSARVAELESK